MTPACSTEKPMALKEKTSMPTLTPRSELPHILMIDDNRGDALLLRMAFKSADLAVDFTIARSVEDGMKALRRQDKYENLERPDVIILDLNMPLMHGSSFLTWVKGEPDFAGIPVIVLSSSTAESDITASYTGSAVGYLTKPYEFEGYENIVKRLGSYWFQKSKFQPMSLAR
jgi:CheY-like chemotaxis protein